MAISGPLGRGLAALVFGVGLAGVVVGCSEAAKEDNSTAETDVKQRKVQDSMKDYMSKKSDAGKK